jgi:glycerophosphoryl diester phosphodiesterase
MWQRARKLDDRPLLVAHRGGTTLAGGDPISGVRRAADLGVAMVEFDVRALADGTLVVYHDAAAAGVRLSSATSDQLAARGIRLATLDEFLAAAKTLALDVELKETGYEAQVVEVLRGHADLERVVVTSFSDAAIAEVKRLAPTLGTGLIVGSRASLVRPWRLVGDIFPFRRLAACDADFLAPSRTLLATGLAHRAARRGVRLLVWGVNDPRQIARYLADPRFLGVVADRVDALAAPPAPGP